MSIKVTSLPDAEQRPRHVAIGTFDGVHVGHRQVIDRADTVLTFEPHPLSVIHPDATPKLIMPFDVKRDVIEGLRVEELVVIPFDHDFSTIPAEEFCSRILVDTLGAEKVSVGENFRFGAKAKGDPEMLAARPEFEIQCSSGTYVRSLIADLGDAYCESLRRIAIGPFTVGEAETLLSLGDALKRLEDGA